MNDTRYMAGLYLRLSKDDERAGESVSIENQRLLLSSYVLEKGWEIKEIYIDDGWSGTDFDRPAFVRMMRDIEDKQINLVIVKDLSRLGRNYIEVGRLTDETFPALGCRFIALNDSVDSTLGDNDMMVYRNLFNEFYSKDTSKKVRAVKQAYMKQGKFLGAYAPLGYKKDPLNKHHLLIDEQTSPIVRRMFEMRCKGYSFRAIARALNKERIPPPRQIYYRRAGRDNPHRENDIWNENSVKAILRSEVYIGNMVQGKSGTISYKNHKQVSKPKEQWVCVKNTHEPLIDRQMWDSAKSLDIKKFKPRKTACGEQNMFIGILRCADCGFNMRANTRNVLRKNGDTSRHISFMCGNYARNGKTACSIHSINEPVLSKLILEELRAHVKSAGYDEQRVMHTIRQIKNRNTMDYLTTYQREMKAYETRLAQIENITQKLYEDRVSGVVTDNMFAALMEKYEKERGEKAEALKTLQEKIKKCETDSGGTDAWTKLIRKYADLETLTQKILLELVDSIEISETEMINGQKTCKIQIAWRFAGNIEDTSAKSESVDKRDIMEGAL